MLHWCLMKRGAVSSNKDVDGKKNKERREKVG